MKAIVYRNYGSPDVLRLEEIEKPTAGDDEILIKVRAAAVNPLDLLFRGTSYMVRIITGLRKPKDTRLGVDVAGQVEAVRRNVTQFKPGDAVFGTCKGAFAEYACAPESALVVKPDNVTFEQAASVPIAALTALQGLRLGGLGLGGLGDKGHIQPGQKVLINGASGGIGTFAVQIAKTFGAEVTGVCSTRNVEMVRSIGADHVIDYTRQDFTRNGHLFDFILDNVANHSLSDTRRVLTPSGKLQSNNGTSGGRWFRTIGTVLKSATVSMFERRQLGPAIKFANRADLLVLKELIEAGKITPVIDATYPLSDTAKALAHVGE